MIILDKISIFKDANGAGYLIKMDDLNLEQIHIIIIRQALKECFYSQKEAAKLLGVSHRSVNYYVKKYGIKHRSWRRNN